MKTMKQLSKTTQRLFMVICLSCTGHATAIAADSPTEPAHLVSTAQAEKRAISPIMMVIGSVHSRQNAKLTAGVEGRLTWVQEAGVHVQAGDVVAKLEQNRLKLEQAQQLALIEREQVTLKGISREAERLKQLIGSNHASQTELDKAQTSEDMAQSNLKLAKIKLAMIMDDIKRTEIKAPFSGIITARYHQIGEDISRSNAIVSITDPENLELRVHAPLKHSKQVRVGDKLRIYHAGGEFEASIRSLIPVSAVRSQTFEARVDIPLEIQDAFSVGELVSLALPIAQKQATILVPRDAIVLRSSGAHLFKINSENKAVKVDITLGDGVGEWIAVQGDVNEHDSVVVRGAETLKAGQQVTHQTPSTSTDSPTQVSAS